ncbi:hypothetical protein PHET_05351 [Paragonimus heterotremus]|uniref:Uncharacterized protein n=1 Tax=Paragonimus heterotremus TaxID=100268 RepID=A0A8J4T8A3_9TREM|nr:hypothetical protein PHET_05351 [Paragonimus heterotremus]
MEPMLCERTNIDLLKTDEPALFTEWTKQLDETEAYLAQLAEQNKQIQMSTDRGSPLLMQKLQTCESQLQDLLTSLNAIKVDIDYVQKTRQTLNERKSIDPPGSIAADLSSLQERHRKTVMTVLVALERLENALPLAQKLKALLIELNEKVASVEEVNDYLETADCPVSRKDMLQVSLTIAVFTCFTNLLVLF